MAMLYKTDGNVTEVTPIKGKKFSLGEVQALIGGYVEMIRVKDGFVLVDEEGLMKGLPLNMAASGKAGMNLVGNVLEGTMGEF